MHYVINVLFSIPLFCIVLVSLLQFAEETFANKSAFPMEGLDRPTAKVQFTVFTPILGPLAFAAMPVLKPLAVVAELFVEPLAVLKPLAAVAKTILEPVQALAAMPVLAPLALIATVPLLKPLAKVDPLAAITQPLMAMVAATTGARKAVAQTH
jgi:hypothetical protein